MINNKISPSFEKSNLDAALYYFEKLSWNVVPLYSLKRGVCTCKKRENCPSPGKHPRVSWEKYQKKHVTEENIIKWWTQQPDSGIGVITGSISNIIVLDIDGQEGISTLKEKQFDCPPTLTSKTGGDGLHCIYNYPGFECCNFAGQSGETILPKVDFRGDGGLIVVPPSMHVSGNKYIWFNSPEKKGLNDPPKWLLNLIKKHSGDNRINSTDWDKELKEGERNTHLTRLAGSLLTRMGEKEAVNKLLAHNEEKCKPPLPKKEVEGIVQSIADREARKKEHDENIIITTNRYLKDLSSETIERIHANNNPPKIFQRGTGLVNITKSRDGHGNKITERPVIEEVSDYYLRGLADRSVNYVRSNGNQVKKTYPPMDVIRDIRAMKDWPFPILTGLMQSPIIRDNGTVFDIPGFDYETSLYYYPIKDIKIIKVNDIKLAVEILKEPFTDFPFVDKASFANVLATVLTIVLRPIINGKCPAFLINKHQQGSGATLLGNVISMIGTGSPVFVETWPTGRSSEEELRKRVTSILVEGHPLVMFDNIESFLKSAVFGSLLTTENWKDRLLGKNKTLRLPHRTVWILNGNNLRVGGDLSRRCYEANINPEIPRPWTRSTDKFKHPNLLNMVEKNRGLILGAIYALAETWIKAGRPAPKNKLVLGMFEPWCATIGGILEYAGIKGFLDNVEDFYEKNETDDGWSNFLAAIYEEFRDKPFTINQVRAKLDRYDIPFEALIPNEFDPLSSNLNWKLGNSFREKEGVIYPNGLYIQKVKEKKQRATKWQIKLKDGFEFK